MDKQEFYLQLSEKLSSLGVDRKYISRHIKQFDEYFSGKSDEEIASEIGKLGDLDRVASRIKKMTDKIAEEEKNNNAKQSSNTDGITADQSLNADTSKELNDDRNDVENNVVRAVEENKAEYISENEEIPDENISVTSDKFISTDADDMSDRAYLTSPAVADDVDVQTESDSDQSPYSDENYNYENEISSYVPDDETISYNTKKFWTIFAISSPLILAILLAITAAFCTAYFLIALLIIFSVIALIGIVAGGTMVSVLGLLFGIVKALSVLPVGIYECGISIVIGGITMLTGILIYNFAVRLMPFAAKQLWRFAKYVKNKLIELFVYVKKECIGS